MSEVTRSATVADVYRDLASLLQTPRTARLTEGVIQCQDNTIQVRLGDGDQPAAVTAGIVLQPGQSLAMGPASSQAGWPLDRVWVVNDTSGSNGTVVLLGVTA